MEDGQQVRFARTALADHDDRPALVRSDGFEALKDVMGWIGDLEELPGGYLRGSVAFAVGELYRRALEPLAEEFLAQFEV